MAAAAATITLLAGSAWSQVVLVIGGAALLGCAYFTDFWSFFWCYLAFSLVYVPSMSVSNAIAFANLRDPAAQFGTIRMGGTVIVMERFDKFFLPGRPPVWVALAEAAKQSCSCSGGGYRRGAACSMACMFTCIVIIKLRFHNHHRRSCNLCRNRSFMRSSVQSIVVIICSISSQTNSWHRNLCRNKTHRIAPVR